MHENKFKIKTNLKKDKINEILSDCYICTLNQGPDNHEPKMRDIYNIMISLDLSQDLFYIKSNTGNKVLSYELIKDAINNWEILPDDISVNKEDLEEIILRNTNNN